METIMPISADAQEFLDTCVEGTYRVLGDGSVDISGCYLNIGPWFKGCAIPLALVGTPTRISVDNAPNLLTLAGLPSKVRTALWVSNCPSLVSLKGAPEVAWDVTVQINQSLRSLEGLPREIAGELDIYFSPIPEGFLLDYEHLPESVLGRFSIFDRPPEDYQAFRSVIKGICATPEEDLPLLATSGDYWGAMYARCALARGASC